MDDKTIFDRLPGKDVPQSERTPDPEYKKQGSEWIAILLLSCAAFGCALAALILAIGK